MPRRFPRASRPSLLLIAALFMAGCSGGGRPAAADENKDGDTKPKKDQLPPQDRQPPVSPKGNDLRLVKPDFILAASELGAEGQKNGGGPTREKYKGKVIELSGVVRWVRRDRDHPERVLLWLYGATKSPLDMLRCVSRDPTPWKEVTPGQTVTIRGKSPDPKYDGNVALVNCAIVEAIGPRVPSLTAAQVSSEYRADPVGFSRKYDENGLILSGEIARTDLVANGQLLSVVLKTPEGGPRVVCRLDNLDEKEGQWKRGQKIKALCESGAALERDEAQMVVYLLMERTD